MSKTKETYPKSRRKNPISGLFDDVRDAIWSAVGSSDHRKSSKYQRFTEDVMRTLLNGFERHQNLSDAKQQALVKKWKTRLESKDFLDDIMCNEMIADLSQFIEDKDAAKKYQEAAKTSIAAVNKGIADNCKEGDERWKWQLLQVFAIMTPLGAFSIAGHVFNYLDPLMDIFGPVFGNAGVAQGVGEVATSKQLGPFGKLAELMRVDDGIRIVLEKTPILKDVIDIADLITTNENVQLMGAELCPLLTASEMPLLAIAGAAVIGNIEKDIDYGKKVRDIDKLQEDTVKKLRDSMPKPKPKSPALKPAEVKQETVVQSKADDKAVSGTDPAPSPKNPYTKGPMDYTKLGSVPGKVDTSSSRGGGITVNS